MSYQTSQKPVKEAWNDSRLGYLGCTWFPKFGPKSLAKLQAKFGLNGGMQAWESSEEQMLECNIAKAAASDFQAWREKSNLKDFKNELDEAGIDFVLPWDKIYPNAFRNSSTPPAALFWRGAPLDSRIWISVVGTRKMSPYGEQATKSIVKGLVQNGVGIISGLALGVDGCAHQAAVEANGVTVAVLGSGIDKATIYPQTHLGLAESILLNNGALISELPPRTPGFKSNFPIRNRLIATLSRATIVVEADKDSGSMLTAKLALDENREVFAVPGPITNPGSEGPHLLIRQGAQLCASADDVLGLRPGLNLQAEMPRDITEEQRKFLDLCRTPVHVDDMARFLQMSPAAVSSVCTSLEIMDLIHDCGGHVYELTTLGRMALQGKKD